MYPWHEMIGIVFVWNPKQNRIIGPDRILWYYDEYQTLYGTVEGIEFQQGLQDLDNLDPRENHFIILDDLSPEIILVHFVLLL
jgi:hypothetical protein